MFGCLFVCVFCLFGCLFVCLFVCMFVWFMWFVCLSVCVVCVFVQNYKRVLSCECFTGSVLCMLRSVNALLAFSVPAKPGIMLTMCKDIVLSLSGVPEAVVCAMYCNPGCTAFKIADESGGDAVTVDLSLSQNTYDKDGIGATVAVSGLDGNGGGAQENGLTDGKKDE